MNKQQFIFFPPLKKQFYFSKNLLLSNEYPLLYSPFKSKAKIFWSLIKNISVIRSFFIVYQDSLPHDIQEILQIIGHENQDLLQINQGTSGPEQKITIIRHHKNGSSTFYKVGKTDVAKDLIRNEYNGLIDLNGKFTAPHVISFKEYNNFLILETTYINAVKTNDTSLNKQIIDLFIDMAQYKMIRDEKLIHTFSHGDFCPWNLLIQNNNLVVIDWEMTEMRPLAYDLFTYIFQTSFLLYPEKTNQEILQYNKNWIKCFFDHFQVAQVGIYLNAFIEIKIKQEALKNKDSILYKKFNLLKNQFSDFQL